MLTTFLNTISKEIASSYIETEKDLAFIFNFTEDIQIGIRKIDNKVSFFSKITPLPPENKELIYTYIMRINLPSDKYNTIIGIDEDEKFLTLLNTSAYEEKYEKFKEYLEDFINYLIYFEEEIKSYEKRLLEKIY
ncbi:MAG: hypothetical protein AMS24_00295 [Chlamydiae bacterium SM23_39]|nr:MAG: hypothetical protein AMS24_00295 [Chlamydiae bacterium SM23_39]